MNYLSALLPDRRTDVIFVGYQAKGSLGRALQNGVDKVWVNGYEGKVNARVHQISGYSTHADKNDLVRFAGCIGDAPKTNHLIHGDTDPKNALNALLQKVIPNTTVNI